MRRILAWMCFFAVQVSLGQIYLQTESELYTYQVDSERLDLVGTFQLPLGWAMTDIAIDCENNMLGVAFDAQGKSEIYEIDKKTGLASLKFHLPHYITHLNALAFDSSGQLWSSGSAGDFIKIDPKSGQVLLHKRTPHRSSGDIVEADVGRLLWSILSEQGDQLIEVRLIEGEPQFNKFKELEGKDIFGLASQEGELFTFFNQGRANRKAFGKLESKLGLYFAPVPGNHRWFGAGSKPEKCG